MIRVILPAHLRTLARTGSEIAVEVQGVATINGVIDSLEALHPALGGTVRDYATGERRPFVRFFACGEDWSHQPPDAALPEEIVAGREPLLIVGAIAGGR